MRAILFASVMLLVSCGGKSKDAAAPAAPAPAAEPVAAPASPAEADRLSDATSGAAAPAPAPAPTPPPIEIPAYTPSPEVSAPIRDAIAATDRSDKDRALDAGRKPGEVLTFFKIAPGQSVGELFAGGGYTTELMARTLGDKGKLYAQNTKEVMDRLARGPLTERAALPVMKNTAILELPATAPFPPDVKNLDAVICILNYHDFVWQKVDRGQLNAAVFAALKPGGVYGIVDHSAAKGSGIRDVESLHRIDEEAVKQEITAAGFKLDAESDVLRNPDDARDWNSSPRAAAERRGTSDRFTLRFVKPGGKATKPAAKKPAAKKPAK